MKYCVIGVDENGEKFNTDVFASCAREAELFVCLRSYASRSGIRVSCVIDCDSGAIHSLETPSPVIMRFDHLLSELDYSLSVGKVSVDASQEFSWLRRTVTASTIPPTFYQKAEALLLSNQSALPASEWLREALIRLSSIGIGLIGSGSLPKTLYHYDLMFQVRATSILYGHVIEKALPRRHLKLIKCM